MEKLSATPSMEIIAPRPWLLAKYHPSMDIKMKNESFERKLQRMKNELASQSILLAGLAVVS